ncbi:hypothetical protein DFH07DRAFT_750441 [Mycena maculata]|uniref:Uncharacterized protein n=1 Tax=Mycena maculata TaxID=230809 RepID=A0AAD7IIP4_9AGAR|nr:hypothetical protein DFH07DRAFT_750441 [Mycena maculata]
MTFPELPVGPGDELPELGDHGLATPPSPPLPPALPNPVGPAPNDIKRIFHPRSEREPIKQSFEEYRVSCLRPDRRPPTRIEPWIPFRTRLDFEVSEFAQDVMMNRGQINTLISLIRRCAENISEFTLLNHADMDKQWDLASKKCTEFQRFDVSVPYKGTEQTFEMYARPLWQWTLDLVQDPHLADFFVWDAEKAYKFDGSHYVRFITEPWTADAMWQTQSKLPKGRDHKICPYIIYADKAKLSSFGTQKGYPIVARLANLVVSLRNSSDWGGGQIVGWLPVVVEDEAESGKPAYANFKNAVWHRSFYCLLESIVLASKTGVWIKCGDGQNRCLFPMILILASDYEEACVMTLIRGLKANYPCPICYIKNEDQSDMTQTPTRRTSEDSQNILDRARNSGLNAEAREQLLKDHGLRNVDNIFWEIAHSDPHQASSFEHLHAYSAGLWYRHLFERVKKHAERRPGRVAARIDQHFAALPRWRNLSHFDSVMSIAFNDGTKHEDISRMMILACHDILVAKIDVLLLQLVRSYQELSLYVTLNLHTTETIAEGRKELLNFDRLLKVLADLGDKIWNFPKIHSHTHAFDDIERKGVSRNFGTKIDEAMHASPRNTYLRQTNFKDVAPQQILKAEHRRLVGKFIRDQLDDLDKLAQQNREDPDTEPADPDVEPGDAEQLADNVVMGAKRPSITFKELEEQMIVNDAAFQRFRIRLSEFLSTNLPIYGYALPGGRRVNLLAEQKIAPFQFLKVFYQSLASWEDAADYLRCNPKFFGRPRYDGALVKTANGDIFVKLIYLFKISVDDEPDEKKKVYHPLALVQPLDAPLGLLSAKDKALKLIRVRARPKQQSEFIFVRSIIRGAVLAPAFDRQGDYLVMDVVDADMYFRLKKRN